MFDNIKAIIFDMDGILVDSEPLWQKAEIKILHDLGIDVTPEMCEPLQGMKLPEAIEYWYNYKPWKNKSFDKIFDEMMAEMKKNLQTVNAMSGVLDTINYYYNKKIPMAIASSSYMVLIEIVVDRLQIRDKIKILHSAEYEKAGKPFPDIFLTTAKKLGVQPADCLVFEDSVNGVKAAKAAGMRVVAIPYPENFNKPEFDIADKKIAAMSEWLPK